MPDTNEDTSTARMPKRGVRQASRTVDAPADAVWEVLSDGPTYDSWVVGASRVRDVDDAWPGPGARLYHSLGVWPLLLHDHTEVVSCVPGHELVLAPRAWPWGAGQVRVRIDGATGGRTVISMSEEVTSGPALLLPQAVRQLLLAARNRECLRRLAKQVQRRSA